MRSVVVARVALFATFLVLGCSSDVPVQPTTPRQLAVQGIDKDIGLSPLLGPSTVAIIGDIPYGTTVKTVLFPALIDAINADPTVSLVAHLGDIKTGSSRCDDSYFAEIRALFDRFADPFVYTPGDNEWTDCHRLNNGSYTPTERLQAVRTLFFPTPGLTLGVRKQFVLSEAFDPANSAYVENVMWIQSRAVFATLNLPGSNNDRVPWLVAGDPAYPSQAEEQAARDQANHDWIRNAFVLARATRAVGVVLISQADMWITEAGMSVSAYDPVVQQIGTLAQEFGKPVLVVEGDSHVFRVDQPFTPASPFYAMHPATPVADNVTRIIVHGSDQPGPMEYLRLTIDPSPRASAVFTWERVPLP